MKNPFGDQNIPGDYRNLKERMYKKVSADVKDQAYQLLINLQNSCENALNSENVVLARAERKRLFSQIVKMVMEDVLK
jgi:hypothetical protein